MRTLCCAVCAMKGSGLGHCSMQHAGGCLIHKLYPLTFSVAALSFCWEGPRGKQCAMPFFLITVCISLIILNTAGNRVMCAIYGFMVFLLGALCYTICTMKAHPQALEGRGARGGAFMAFFFVSVMFDKA